MSAIQISAVRKQFGKQEILKSIDLEIRDKEFTVLLGPSGCGKSTLLRIIAGLEYESSGSIRIGEREITSLAPRDRRIAVMKGGQIEQYAPPSEIYHYPATEFVGSFIGNPPMNFIAPDARWHQAAPAASQIHRCGIRPEDFEVRFEPTEDFAPVRVLVTELLGSHKQLTARFGDEMLRVNVPSDLEIANGSDIHIRPLAEKMRFYDHSGRLMSA